MGGPIMFLSIERWAERNGLASQDDFAGLLAALSVLDEEWRRKSPNAPKGRPLSPELFDALF
ncbi:hypothetical protein VE26_05590 [Devosia chinhatensis]|uniref:Uncharacterized protein n=2 Tax=Devosia chinhatensis TaxID=429727 RepID=A0A0F5FKT0_9HYPH|nr:hypothetical protein VE26_05590 [Devosia chinhatensis]